MIINFSFFVCMSSGYISPEYVAQGRISEKIDVYSFGVIIMEMLSGKKNIGYPTYDLNLIDYVSFFKNFAYPSLHGIQL